MEIGKLSALIVARDNPPSLIHAARTAVAAVASYLIAHVLRLPEAYWASISTLIVRQSRSAPRSRFLSSVSWEQRLERLRGQWPPHMSRAT